MVFVIPKNFHLRPNGAAVAFHTCQFKTDPMIIIAGLITVDFNGAVLACNNDVESTPIPNVGIGHGPAVQFQRSANGRRYLLKFTGAVVEPNFILLIT